MANATFFGICFHDGQKIVCSILKVKFVLSSKSIVCSTRGQSVLPKKRQVKNVLLQNLSCRTNLTLQNKLNQGGISLFYKDLVCSTHLQVLWHTHSLKLHTNSLQLHAKTIQNKLKVMFDLFYIANSLNIKLEETVEQTEPL